MRFRVAGDLDALGSYIPRFLMLVGEDRWFRRADHLDNEQKKSASRWKIVAGYHWLELAISHQSEILRTEGHLFPAFADAKTLAALHFAAAVVEVHCRLSHHGQRVLDGRLRDSLKAETGFAPVYLELDLAARLMADGYEVNFSDMEGTGRFDLEFSRDTFVGEVECKSISVDAGRRIHRKDFYRFIDALAPAWPTATDSQPATVVVVTLRDRLAADETSQIELRRAVSEALNATAPATITQRKFRIQQLGYAECLKGVPFDDPRAMYAACASAFGADCHVAGDLTPGGGGCLVVMRSDKADDTSKPLLEAMRKAACQFSGKRPSFIAVQFQEIEPADLMLPHLRRRMGILSYALFGQYAALHVNGTYFCGFGAVIARQGQIGTPAFGVLNPKPKFVIGVKDAAPFCDHVPDIDFAAAIGASVPGPKVPDLPI
jgi:hypothetical protein